MVGAIVLMRPNTTHLSIVNIVQYVQSNNVVYDDCITVVHHILHLKDTDVVHQDRCVTL